MSDNRWKTLRDGLIWDVETMIEDAQKLVTDLHSARSEEDMELALKKHIARGLDNTGYMQVGLNSRTTH